MGKVRKACGLWWRMVAGVLPLPYRDAALAAAATAGYTSCQRRGGVELHDGGNCAAAGGV